NSDRTQKIAHFEERLLVLALLVGVDHDPSTGVRVSRVFGYDDRSNGDVEVRRPVESEIPDAPGVDAALHAFELVDDLHRPDLRGARDGAPREGRAEQVVDGSIAAEGAAHRRDELVHGGVALELREVIDRYRPGLTDAPQVAAHEVDDHRKLCAVLAAVEKPFPVGAI